MRNHFEAWRAIAIERHDNRVSVPDHVAARAAPLASIAASAPAPVQPAPSLSDVASSSSHLRAHHPHTPSLLLKYSTPALFLKYFNAWFTFANVSQWARDLNLEHELARLKSAFAGWKLACRRRRPRAPLSPASAAAAGVTGLMQQTPARAPRSLRSVQPSDVAVSLDFLDSSPPMSPTTDSQRPGSRRLVSPDDSARIMFFFGGPCP